MMKQFLKAIAARAYALSGAIRERRNGPGLLVLMLHNVSDQEDPLPLTLSPERFDALLREITAHHDVVALEDVIADGRCRVGRGLAVALTFDDGYRDNYEVAFPLLVRHKVPATIYLSVDHIDGSRQFWHRRLVRMIDTAAVDALDLRAEGEGWFDLRTRSRRRRAILSLNDMLKRYDDAARDERLSRWARCLEAREETDRAMLSWNQAREMNRDGIRFGSHTLSHPILSRESESRVRREVEESKNILESRLGTAISGFAYPNGTAGDFNTDVVEAVRRAGYQYACTTIPGINREDENVFTLRRVNLHNRMCTDASGRFDKTLFWARALGLMQAGGRV